MRLRVADPSAGLDADTARATRLGVHGLAIHRLAIHRLAIHGLAIHPLAIDRSAANRIVIDESALY